MIDIRNGEKSLYLNFWTYLMIVFKIWLQGWEMGVDGGNPVMQGDILVPPFLLEVASIWHKVSK